MPDTFLRRRVLVLACGAVALPLALGACSSSSTGSGVTTTTRATGHQGASSPCATVTPAQVERTLGKPVRTPSVINSARTTLCTYPSSVSDLPSASVSIGFRGRVTSADFTSERTRLGKVNGTTADVSGVGDLAYSYSQTLGGQTVNSLVTLVDQTQVNVTSTASIDQAETLTREIFATIAAETTTTPTTAP